LKNTIVEKLKSILVDELFVDVPKDKIGLDDGFQTILGLDSVAFTELALLVERHFQIGVPDDEFSPENFRSLSLLADYIERKLAA
jgi:acyl carrier protein